MDIRKADAKGRVTGFTPGAHYRVIPVPAADGTWVYTLEPLATGGYVSGTAAEGSFS